MQGVVEPEEVSVPTLDLEFGLLVGSGCGLPEIEASVSKGKLVLLGHESALTLVRTE
jgi:hypothetical protein